MATGLEPYWAEYDAAADWCAARGLKGAIGDPLPENMSADAVQAIADDPDAFADRVRASAYRRAMLKHNPPEE